jgi:hypothetical protein
MNQAQLHRNSHRRILELQFSRVHDRARSGRFPGCGEIRRRVLVDGLMSERAMQARSRQFPITVRRCHALSVTHLTQLLRCHMRLARHPSRIIYEIFLTETAMRLFLALLLAIPLGSHVDAAEI